MKDYILPTSILLSSIILASAWIYNLGTEVSVQKENSEARLFPQNGFAIPVQWRNLGKQMVSTGVIDLEKLAELYASRGGLSEAEKKLLTGDNNGPIVISEQNAAFLLNLFWALGLGNKNGILENGPMTDFRYGGAGNFASTAGWTLADGDAMNHYSQHSFIVLTPEQQVLVERVSKSIYRPCCNNSTYFPDCNHGMAMLGLLELMAAQGVNESEMYQIALRINTFWFPDNYLTIAQYLKSKEIDWETADPKMLLGANFSSVSGYKQILQSVNSAPSRSSGGCGVEAGTNLSAPAKTSGGCGV